VILSISTFCSKKLTLSILVSLVPASKGREDGSSKVIEEEKLLNNFLTTDSGRRWRMESSKNNPA